MASGLVEVANRDDVFAGVTYVIAEERDDVASLRSRLGAVSGWRVALVLPRASKALESPVAMRLVARAAAEEGINLAIVSPRGRTRWLAELEGLPAFPSVRAIPGHIRAARADPLDPLGRFGGDVLRRAGASASWVFAVVIVLGLIGFGVLTIPVAVVTVRPYTERIDGVVRLRASVNAAQPDPQTGQAPGRQLYAAVDASGSVPVASNRPLDGYAVGYVTFTNRTKDKVVVPAGSDVDTYTNNHFVTLEPATLDARAGATATVRVRATSPGPADNVRGGAVREGNFPTAWQVLVVNADDMAGGGAVGRRVVTSWDTHAVYDQVAAKAQGEARSLLASQVAPGDAAVPETVVVTPIAEAYDRAIGQTADTLTLRAQFRVSAMIVSPEQIKQLAIRMWNPSIPSGFGVRPGSVAVDPDRVDAFDASSVTYSVPIHAIIFKTIDPSQIAREVRFRDEKTAQQDLRRLFDLAAPPTVRVTPDWTGRAYRVDVIVDTSAPPAPPTEPQQTTAPSPSAPPAPAPRGSG